MALFTIDHKLFRNPTDITFRLKTKDELLYELTNHKAVKMQNEYLQSISSQNIDLGKNKFLTEMNEVIFTLSDYKTKLYEMISCYQETITT